ncbi:hypothetical protein [uncultured Jatrophihabitans sp.]|uniref:hypothetical protein n=1 Tax=uncultured Jatrophihabitans sp. TaxID=1610747 RepID=UPI0035CB7895
MTRARVAAAAAGVVTALLLQATVVGPAAAPWPVSLPAVLVAVVALVDGPGPGMSFGFAVGLVADLGSHHAAGVLALCWLGVGLVCGTLAQRRSARRDALVAAVVCALAASLATLLLAATHGGGSAGDALGYLAPTAVGDLVLALLLTPLVRAMLRANSLRAAQPVFTELVLRPTMGDHHG